MLDEEEERYCAQSALGAPSDRNFTAEDVEAILQKRLLAGKAYSYKLSYEQIDEDSIAASVDREAYTAYEVEYLYVPLYVYSANDALLEKCLAELQSLKDFEGDYADAVRLSAYLLAGNMTLCPADCESDMALLTAAKELSVGETSKPITTDYGLFMIRLLNDSDDSLYEAEVEKRLLNARKRAYRAEYNRLYAEAEYSLDPEYWNTLKP